MKFKSRITVDKNKPPIEVIIEAASESKARTLVKAQYNPVTVHSLNPVR